LLGYARSLCLALLVSEFVERRTEGVADRICEQGPATRLVSIHHIKSLIRILDTYRFVSSLTGGTPDRVYRTCGRTTVELEKLAKFVTYAPAAFIR
jgi:hypothetical protein